MGNDGGIYVGAIFDPDRSPGPEYYEHEMKEAVQDAYYLGYRLGIASVVKWIEMNAVYSHSPADERILIRRHEWNLLKQGQIPKERINILLKNNAAEA